MFHVPELARITIGAQGTDQSYGNNGAFILESPEPGWRLFAICSDGSDPDPSLTDAQRAWEHVSISARNSAQTKTRIPTWRELAYMKRLYWDAEDVVVQFHPRESEYVNCHPHVLHLWRPKHVAIPTPPPELVGPMVSVEGVGQ
jgi:hypothetical protein